MKSAVLHVSILSALIGCGGQQHAPNASLADTHWKSILNAFNSGDIDSVRANCTNQGFELLSILSIADDESADANLRRARMIGKMANRQFKLGPVQDGKIEISFPEETRTPYPFVVYVKWDGIGKWKFDSYHLPE